MSATPPASLAGASPSEPNLEWAPFGAVVFEIGASFDLDEDGQAQPAAAQGGRLFAHVALACSRELAMAPPGNETLPAGIWRSWMEKSGAGSGVWRRLDLAETPSGVVPVALVEAKLPAASPTLREAAAEIALWVERCQAERVPELRRNFLVPRFARMTEMDAGSGSADKRPARQAVARMIAEREGLALAQELRGVAEALAAQSGSSPRAGASGGLAPAAASAAAGFGGVGASVGQEPAEDWGGDELDAPDDDAPPEEPPAHRCAESERLDALWEAQMHDSPDPHDSHELHGGRGEGAGGASRTEKSGESGEGSGSGAEGSRGSVSATPPGRPRRL